MTSKSDEIAAKELKYTLLFERGVDFENRVIRINGEINDEVFDLVDTGMTIMEKQGRGNIIIRINSDGGEVYSALAIVGRLKKSKSVKIITEGYGRIMSAATLILACGDKRRISQYAFFMHHEAAYDAGDLKLSSMKHQLAQWEAEEKFWAEKMAEFTEKDANWWAKQGVGQDAYFSPEQLLDFGVVDEIF